MRIEAGKPLLDTGHGRVQVFEATHLGAEFVAVLLVIPREPAGTDTENRAPAGNVVHRSRHVGEELRVTIAVAGHQQSDLNPLRRLGYCGKQCPALEMLAFRVAEQRVEMIPRVNHVHTQRFCLLRGTAYVRVLGMLRIN